MADSVDLVVDARGHRCPVPSLKLRKALAAAPLGAKLRLLTNDPLARIDVPHLLAELDAELVEVTQARDEITFVVAR